MANEQNLVPFTSDQNREEAAKNGRKGGKASGASKRQKKALREIAEAIGTAQAPEEVKAKMRRLGLTSKKKITLDEAIMMAQYGKALSGSVQSANFIAEMKGEKIQRVEQINIDDKSMSRLNDDFGFGK